MSIYKRDLYNYDYAYLKKLGQSYKLVRCNCVRKKGFELVDYDNSVDFYSYRIGMRYKSVRIEKKIADLSSNTSSVDIRHVSTNEEKLANNITRARNKILEYVLCNDFVYFVTLTLDSEKYDRYNLAKFIKDLQIFIKNYRVRNNCDIKYLFIPESHADGAWHMHGFIMGLPSDHLSCFELHGEKKLPPYIVKKLENGEPLYYWGFYERRFGYNIFEVIRNKKASVLYMCKYLTKDISHNVKELGNHLYYCSQGLNKAEIVKQGQFLDCGYEFQFNNDHCSISMYDSLNEDDLELIKSKIGGEPVSLDDYLTGRRIDADGWQSVHDSDTGEIFGNTDIFNIFESEVM